MAAQEAQASSSRGLTPPQAVQGQPGLADDGGAALAGSPAPLATLTGILNGAFLGALQVGDVDADGLDEFRRSMLELMRIACVSWETGFSCVPTML